MRLNKNSGGKSDEDFLSADMVPTFPPSRPLQPYSSADDSVVPRAVVGAKIHFKGELSGEEDLLIQGRVEGTVDLKGHHLTVGKLGVVKANLKAKTITIEGSVEGDLFAQERICIKASSEVTGNLVADRVTLEDGARFRGTIDMESNKKAETRSLGTEISKKAEFVATDIESAKKTELGNGFTGKSKGEKAQA